MALQRVFKVGGRRGTYYFHAQFRLQSQADALARTVREEGGLARVTFENDRWIVWSRDRQTLTRAEKGKR